MHFWKRVLAAALGVLTAATAVLFYISYATRDLPPGFSPKDSEIMLLEPAVEGSLLFVITLRIVSNFFGRRLKVIGAREHLIHVPPEHWQMMEILGSVLAIMFRGVFRLYPDPFNATDAVVIAGASVNLLYNIYQGVKQERRNRHLR